ncbi:hypothetical protein [Rhodococcus sp. O3]|uniref:hypothetical protein n=1 Tax=Rhodococcus sp. O3 TaxID=3404919 RepID=UPI003B66C351
MNTTRISRSSTVALLVGCVLTVVAAIAVYGGQTASGILTAHVRAGYPSFTQDHIDAATDIYLTYLIVLGVLGALGWLTTLWVARRSTSWARLLATGLWVVATGIALFDLTVRDTSGDTALPATVGWMGLAPCVAGLVAVVLLWRRPSHEKEALR